ncbi:MAG TPA: ABC transporter permease [Terracidiphilus sp.]|nr:ABC transporter permease [Terracidiphilus sp.]
MGELFRRIKYLLNRRRMDAELESDMEFHREMVARAGRNNFGNSLRIREQAQEAWGWTWLDRLRQDLSYASRILARSPGFTGMAVLVLAIGIGVNVSAFSLFNMVALKPLPVRDADRIVRLERRSPNNSTSEMPYTSLKFYEKHAKTLSAVIGVLGVPPLQVDEDVQPASASFVTPNYFTELGTPAALGRMIDPRRDGEAGNAPVAVLSYGYWQRRFGSDPTVIGRTIHLNKKPVMIAGVTPYDFASLGGQHPDIWLPMAQQPYLIDGSKLLIDPSDSAVRMWGKLAPGVPAKAAEQELRGLTNDLRRLHPKDIWDGEYIASSPGGHLQVMQPEMYQVAAMVGVLTLLILAVACANLGALMLAKAVTREHEIGIRVAIGANRGRIFRQLCTESLLLAILGSIAGLGLGFVVISVALNETDAPKWLSAAPDWRVLLFTLGLTFAAAIFFGLAPALQIARQRQKKTMARQTLVAAQVAASSVLLIVAGLLVHATQHALYTNPGFGYEQVLTVDPQLSQHGYTPAAAKAYFGQMQDRLLEVPGVKSVSMVRLPPLGHTVSREDLEINGRPVSMYPNWVAPGFFETMNISLLAGRTFYPQEKNAVIVSESMARQQWPHQNPLGQLVGDGKQKDMVVGVVGDARINDLSNDDEVEQYWPMQDADMASMALVVKTAGEPGSLAPVVKTMSESLDPKVFPEIRQLRVLYRENVLTVERVAASVSLIGLVAVLLAGAGIIGLVAFTVSQRTKEIAIRIALGARPAAVLNAVLRQFFWPVVIGLFLGTGIAAASSKVLRKGLYGISNLDPLSYAGAIAVLALIVAASALLPARRTLRLDLAKILHYD